jgi:thiol:disulfide interchange protein DsbG
MIKLARLTTALLISIVLLGCDGSQKTDSPSKSTTSESSTENLDKILQHISQGQAKIEKTFPGPDGLMGIIAKDMQGQSIVLWASPGGEILIPGAAIDRDGNNLNETMRLELGLDSPSAATLTRAANPNSRAIIQGTQGPVLTVFIDPNCIHCHHLFKDVQKPISEGKLRVRYVLNGFLNDTSKGIAAAIISSKDPLAALLKAENGYDEKKGLAGLAPLSPVPEELASIIDENNKTLQAAGGVSTPTLLFCNTKDNSVTVARGAPQDLEALLSTLSEDGHPACKQ